MESKLKSVTLNRLFLLLVLVGSSLAACQRLSQQEDQAPELSVSLQVDPQPAVVGPASLKLEIKDQSGQPVPLSELSVRGDMSHAGMVPVFGDPQLIDDGTYEVPFEWTMAGDWILTIRAELADGRILLRQMQVAVSGEEDQMMEGM